MAGSIPFTSDAKRRRNNPVTQFTDGLAKMPPQATDLEDAVLGAIMIQDEAINAVVDILHAPSFYKEANQRIYTAILALFNKNQKIDVLTVVQQLSMQGDLQLAGGAYYVTQLTSRVNTAAHIEAHARIVAEKAILRDLIRIASDTQRDAYEETTDVFDLLDKTEQSIFQVSESNIRKEVSAMSGLLPIAIKELEARKDHKDGLTGIGSGFSDLDRVTSGWQRSDLLILAARPGMGKTAFVVSAARNAAVMFQKKVAIFSLEMSQIQLVNRIISAEAELDSEKIKKGNLAEHEWRQLHHKIAALESAPLFIDDTPALSMLELRAKCRRMKSRTGLDMIIIDYLQLMQGDASAKGNREQEIASISRGLKNLAKELDVPVIALSQLSRAVETRGGAKRPQLSDLRESGSIEQDADIVMFLYRPEYYGITADEEGKSVENMAELIIAKHRNGSTATVELKFHGAYTKFGDMEPDGFRAPSSTPFPDSGGIPSGFDDRGPTRTLKSKMNQNPNDFIKPDDSPVPF
ncbi:MAG: replicative DNA helicase [Bacteroidota bacterium]